MSDVSRLPKWAQARIEALERDAAHWKRAALEGPEDADTFLCDLMEQKPLGRGVRVRFILGGEGTEERVVEVRAEDGQLVVNSASHALFVVPWSTNMLRLFVGDVRGTEMRL